MAVEDSVTVAAISLGSALVGGLLSMIGAYLSYRTNVKTLATEKKFALYEKLDKHLLAPLLAVKYRMDARVRSSDLGEILMILRANRHMFAYCPPSMRSNLTALSKKLEGGVGESLDDWKTDDVAVVQGMLQTLEKSVDRLIGKLGALLKE